MDMQSSGKISVIVPVYCVEEYLDDCIESLLHQTYQNLEIILVDDGSPDSCPGLCDHYAEMDPRIVVIHKENEGVAKARNEGLKRASGDYIGFVDSDDCIDEKMYESLINICEENHAEMASVRYDEIHGQELEKTNCTGEVIVFDSTEYFRNMAFMNDKYLITPSVWTNLYRRELIDGLWFPDSRKIGEDMYFNMQAIAKASKCAYYDKNLYHYRIRENSVIHTGFGNYNQLLLDLLPYYEEELTYFQKYYKPALLFFMCQYYNMVIPLSAVKLSKDEKERVKGFLDQNRLPIGTVVSMEMPLKTKLNSVKKHGFRTIYTVAKTIKNSILNCLHKY